MSIIGPLTAGLDVERAVLTTLKDWLPLYLREAAGQGGVKPGLIEEPESWMVLSEVDRWPESKLPAVIIAAPGLNGTPEKKGDGSYDVDWKLEVSVSIAAGTPPAARRYSQIYAAAIVGTILQRRSLGSDLRATDWIDLAFGTASRTEKRTVAAAATVFNVEQKNVVNWRMGPKGDEPPETVPESYPTVGEVDVEMEIE